MSSKPVSKKKKKTPRDEDPERDDDSTAYDRACSLKAIKRLVKARDRALSEFPAKYLERAIDWMLDVGNLDLPYVAPFTADVLLKYPEEKLAKWFDSFEADINDIERCTDVFTGIVKGRKPEAPLDAPFERFFNDAEARQGYEEFIEPNTEIEGDYVDAINDHFEDGETLSLERGLFLWKLAKKGQYERLLKLPKSTRSVYRGMGTDSQTLKKLLHVAKNKQMEAVGKVKGNFLYKPWNGCCSWTLNRDVAQSFAEDSAIEDGLEYELVITADPYFGDNKFIINPRNSGDYGLGVFSSEEETIGVGPIRAYEMSWRMSEDYDDDDYDDDEEEEEEED